MTEYSVDFIRKIAPETLEKLLQNGLRIDIDIDKNIKTLSAKDVVESYRLLDKNVQKIKNFKKELASLYASLYHNGDYNGVEKAENFKNGLEPELKNCLSIFQDKLGCVTKEEALIRNGVAFSIDTDVPIDSVRNALLDFKIINAKSVNCLEIKGLCDVDGGTAFNHGKSFKETIILKGLKEINIVYEGNGVNYKIWLKSRHENPAENFEPVLLDEFADGGG